jgi:hypothetical protein
LCHAKYAGDLPWPMLMCAREHKHGRTVSEAAHIRGLLVSTDGVRKRPEEWGERVVAAAGNTHSGDTEVILLLLLNGASMGSDGNLY